MSKSLTIWTNASLPDFAMQKLRSAVSPNRLIVPASVPTTNLVSGGPDPTLAEADVAFGQPDPQQVIDLPKLKWVHLNSAGYTRYDTANFRGTLTTRGGALTNSSGVYDEPCAEHLLAMMLAFSRQLPRSTQNQLSKQGWPHLPLRAGCNLLLGQSALIYGFGKIAARLCEMLAPFRMNLIGVRRKVRGDEPIRTLTTEEAEDWLSKVDHVVNILPASPETDGFFNAERFAKLSKSAHFYNIGRGTTVDQFALAEALNGGQFAGAYLDVTTPEPLLAESPLWRAANCHITPHTAGGHATEFDRLVDHFIANLRRFLSGESLEDRIV